MIIILCCSHPDSWCWLYEYEDAFISGATVAMVTKLASRLGKKTLSICNRNTFKIQQDLVAGNLWPLNTSSGLCPQVTFAPSSSGRRLLCTRARTSWRGWTPPSRTTASNGIAPCVWRTAPAWRSNASCPRPSRARCRPSSSRRWACVALGRSHDRLKHIGYRRGTSLKPQIYSSTRRFGFIKQAGGKGFCWELFSAMYLFTLCALVSICGSRGLCRNKLHWWSAYDPDEEDGSGSNTHTMSVGRCIQFWLSSPLSLSSAAGRAGEGPEVGLSHRPVPGKAPRPGGEQPTGGHRDAAEADAEQPDHGVFLRAG